MIRKFTLPEFEPDGANIRAPQLSRRDSFTQSKLSRLPKLPKRQAFTIPNFDREEKQSQKVNVCVGCSGKVDAEDATQKSFNGCRKCVEIYGRLDQAFEENQKRKKRETLERFASTLGR